MIDKFSTQFIRIFSRPLPLPPIIGLDDEVTLDVISDQAFARRMTWYEQRAAARARTAEAFRLWQHHVEMAHRAKLDWIDALSISDPAFLNTVVMPQEKAIARSGDRATTSSED